MAVTWLYDGEIAVRSSTKRVTFYMAGTAPTSITISKNGAAFGGSFTATQIGTEPLYYFDLTNADLDFVGPLVCKVTNGTDTLYIKYDVVAKPQGIYSKIPTSSTFTHTYTKFEVESGLTPSGWRDSWMNAYVVWVHTASGILESGAPYLITMSRAETGGVPPVFGTTPMPWAPDNGDEFVIIRG